MRVLEIAAAYIVVGLIDTVLLLFIIVALYVVRTTERAGGE